MRREFSESIKRILAARVAYRCSCPGCSRITIGPSNEKMIRLSILAKLHIFMQPVIKVHEVTLTNEQIVSIDNGIGLCRHHGRMIDADQINYPQKLYSSGKCLLNRQCIPTCKTWKRMQSYYPKR